MPNVKREVNRDWFQCDAGGDDLIILAQRIPDYTQGVPFGLWDFDGADIAFSNTYGRGGFTPGVLTHAIFTDGGIRVNVGTNP